MNEEEDLLQKLVEENRALKERILELEEQLGHGQESLVKESTRIMRVIHLLQTKDKTLGEYAAELEGNKTALEENVRKLEKKNQQLQLWVSALRLYQDIIENEAAAVIGINREGKVVLYNRATLAMFGEKFRELVGQDFDAIDFSKFDPYTPRFIRAVLQKPDVLDRKVTLSGRTIHTFAYPMGKGDDFRGVLLKIAVSE